MRQLQQQVLAAFRQLLGEAHPDTLTAMNDLALTLSAQGDRAGARQLQEQVLVASRQLLGEAHPHTLTAMNNLAQMTQAQNRSERHTMSLGQVLRGLMRRKR